MPQIKIYKRGKTYHYRGTVQGERLRGSTGAIDEAAAKKFAAKIEREAWARSLAGPPSVTFAQAAIQYLDDGRSDRFLAEVAAYWKDRPCNEINSELVRQGAKKVYRKASAATRNRQFIVPTQAVVNYAAGLGKCPPLKVKKFNVVKREKDFGTWNWLQEFMQAADPHMAAVYAFMYFTGARIGECLPLRWADVSWTDKRVRIVMGKLDGQERRPYMPDELRTVLRPLSIRMQLTDRVFPFANRSTVQKKAIRICDKAGIKYLSPHTMRHGFATGLLHKGVDPVTIARLGGWKSPAHVFATYGHARDDETLADMLSDTTLTQNAEQENKSKAYIPLAGERLRPLGHLSTAPNSEKARTPQPASAGRGTNSDGGSVANWRHRREPLHPGRSGCLEDAGPAVCVKSDRVCSKTGQVKRPGRSGQG